MCLARLWPIRPRSLKSNVQDVVPLFLFSDSEIIAKPAGTDNLFNWILVMEGQKAIRRVPSLNKQKPLAHTKVQIGRP